MPIFSSTQNVFSAMRSSENITEFLFSNVVGINNINTTTYTFTNVNIGPEHPNRVLFLHKHCFNTVNNNARGLVSVDGQSTTFVNRSIETDYSILSEVFYLAKPTGTTANITATFATNTLMASIGLISINSKNPGSPLTTSNLSISISSANTSPLTRTVNAPITVPQDGGLISFAGTTVGVGSYTDFTFSSPTSNKQFSTDYRSGEVNIGSIATNLTGGSYSPSGTMTATGVSGAWGFGMVVVGVV